MANPIGQIWCGAMMLEHLGHCADAGAAVLAAIEKVLGRRTLARRRRRDIGGTAGTADLGRAIAEAAGNTASSHIDPRTRCCWRASGQPRWPPQTRPRSSPPPPAAAPRRPAARSWSRARPLRRWRWRWSAPTRAAPSLDGIVVTRYAHGLPTEGSYPRDRGRPSRADEAGEQAAADILALYRRLGPEDRLIVLVSGGGSSLLSLPAEGIAMADSGLKATTRELLRCGAPITGMNIVRKHLSRIQGGRLAQASKAPVTTLIVSDVAGDDPAARSLPVPQRSIGAPTPTRSAILQRAMRAKVPAPVQSHLERRARGEIDETPKPGDPLLPGSRIA